jgi:uncharacterized protein involved in type VI secretion and phage assembly
VSGHRAVRTIRSIARHELEQRWTTALGVVKSVYGNDEVDKQYACTIELRDTGLVLPRVPIATGVVGAASLPREKDLVVVVFAGGDLHAPIVVGRLYSEDVAPPKHGPGEFVTVLPGDEDASDKRLDLRVSTPGDGTRTVSLVLDGSVNVALEIKDDGVTIQAGDATIKLTQTTSSNGRAELQVGDAKLMLTQAGDVSIEATGTLTLQAAKIEINGDASVKLAGTTIDLN